MVIAYQAQQRPRAWKQLATAYYYLLLHTRHGERLETAHYYVLLRATDDCVLHTWRAWKQLTAQVATAYCREGTLYVLP